MVFMCNLSHTKDDTVSILCLTRACSFSHRSDRFKVLKTTGLSAGLLPLQRQKPLSYCVLRGVGNMDWG